MAIEDLAGPYLSALERYKPSGDQKLVVKNNRQIMTVELERDVKAALYEEEEKSGSYVLFQLYREEKPQFDVAKRLQPGNPVQLQHILSNFYKKLVEKK